jgi:hypothetical protein
VPRDLGRSPWAESCGYLWRRSALLLASTPLEHGPDDLSSSKLSARPLSMNSDRSGGTTLVCDRAQRRRTAANDGARDATATNSPLRRPYRSAGPWRRDAPSSRIPAVPLWEKPSDSAATRFDLRARTRPTDE